MSAGGPNREAHRQVVPDGLRYENASWRREGLQARCDVHTVAHEIGSVDHHVAKVNCDAPDHALGAGASGFRFSNAILYGKRAPHCIDGTAEFDQEAVTHGLEQPPPVLLQGRIDYRLALPREAVQRFLFGVRYETAESDHICADDGGETSVHGIPPTAG